MDLPGYDRWKLATPPEYEWPPGEEQASYEDGIRDRIDELMQTAETIDDWIEICRLADLIGDERQLPPTLEDALDRRPVKIDPDQVLEPVF